MAPPYPPKVKPEIHERHAAFEKEKALAGGKREYIVLVVLHSNERIKVMEYGPISGESRAREIVEDGFIYRTSTSLRRITPKEIKEVFFA